MDTQQRLTGTRASAAPFPSRARAPLSPLAARTIVIVGAGFSGTAVAIHLLRLPHSEPLRIVLVERAQLAGGVAYARRE
jgi:myosin-crossreactive antigen